MIQTKKNRKNIKVTFTLPNDGELGEVSVVGEFNDWTPGITPFVKENGDGLQATVELDKDEVYAFRYLSEGRGWFNEDENVQYEPSPYGSFNCMLQT